MKRFVQTEESPYHGLNFCQGTVAEMLDDPAGEIADVIRWFGTRDKIFNVHFRNISGRKLDIHWRCSRTRARWTWPRRCECTARSVTDTC